MSMRHFSSAEVVRKQHLQHHLICVCAHMYVYVYVYIPLVLLRTQMYI